MKKRRPITSGEAIRQLQELFDNLATHKFTSIDWLFGPPIGLTPAERRWYRKVMRKPKARKKIKKAPKP